MSPTRLAWYPLRANTRTAASRSCRRLSSAAAGFVSTKPRERLLRFLAVRLFRLRCGDLVDGPGDTPHSGLQLARDDPDLVRVALRDLRQHLQVLVREQLGIRLPVVDGLEYRLDRLRLALGLQHHRLPLALSLEDRRLLLALGPEDRRLPLALGLEDRGALVAVGAHLLFHRVLDRGRRVDRLQLDAGGADAPLARRVVEHTAQLGVDRVARGERLLERHRADHV